MPDFLLELLSEEIPARMQARARADLQRLFEAELAAAGLAATSIETYATPRRLALIARDLPPETPATSEERKGPRADAPDKAIEGFLRSTGMSRGDLVSREDAKGATVLFAVVEKPGRATTEVLAEAIPAIVRAFPWPKSMRWGAASLSPESLRWVRPLHGIVALLGEEIVPVEIAGIRAGAASVGHRFHHPGPITLGGAHDYIEKMRACHVIVDPDERAGLIRDGATALAAEAGLTLVLDEALVLENAGLTEWPVPLLGRFNAAFLQVPREVIQLTMRTNQKYFALTQSSPAFAGGGDHPKGGGGAGKAGPTPGQSTTLAGAQLAPAFVCIANIAATDGGACIVEGNQKVLAARLSDARFFWEQDLKVPLERQAEKLSEIVFHEKLGTVADKADRVAKLARWLVEEGIVTAKSSPALAGEGDHAQHGGGARSEAEGAAAGRTAPDGRGPSTTASGGGPPPRAELGEDQAALATLAERAARLCKADLVTQMVGEFPELQGVIGGHLARAQGHPPEVADAIRDHYKPVGQGDEVPTEPVTVAVSLADKLDTIAGFFLADLVPTGSKDPFALRRTSIGVSRLILQNGISHSLSDLIDGAMTLQAHRVLLEANTKLEPSSSVIELFKSLEINLSRVAEQISMRFAPIQNATTDSLSVEFEVPDFSNIGLSIPRIVLHLPKEPYLLSAGQIANVHSPPALDFAIDRLKVQQREAGVRHDLIDAVFALGGEDDLVRLLARVRALQAFVETAEGADLLAGYKRAANILKKEGWQTQIPSPLQGRGSRGTAERGEGESPSDGQPPLSASLRSLTLSPGGEREIPLSYTPEKEETALVAALDAAEPRAANAIASEDFGGAMAALATLRAPVDAFFDEVTVNDPDPAKRAARLALLARMRAAFHRIADFSKIEA